jgi:hypothetical protein
MIFFQKKNKIDDLFYKKGEYCNQQKIIFISIFIILAKFHTEKTPCGDRLVTYPRLR